MALEAYLCSGAHRAIAAPHVCTSRCKFWEHRPTQSFVCRSTHCVHECGPKCGERVLDYEGEVCRLTGFVVGEPELIFQWSKHKDNKRSRQTHRGAAPTPKSREQRRGELIGKWGRWVVSELFAGKGRAKIRSHHIMRLSTSMERVTRTKGTFLACQAHLFNLVKEHERALRPGLPLEHPTIKLVGDRVVELCEKHIGAECNRATVCAHAAACFMRLEHGHEVAGVDIFPKVPFVSANGPEHINYPDLIGIRCSRISKANRSMTDHMVSSAGLPNMQSLL